MNCKTIKMWLLVVVATLATQSAFAQEIPVLTGDTVMFLSKDPQEHYGSLVGLYITDSGRKLLAMRLNTPIEYDLTTKLPIREFAEGNEAMDYTSYYREQNIIHSISGDITWDYNTGGFFKLVTPPKMEVLKNIINGETYFLSTTADDVYLNKISKYVFNTSHKIDEMVLPSRYKSSNSSTGYMNTFYWDQNHIQPPNNDVVYCYSTDYRTDPKTDYKRIGTYIAKASFATHDTIKVEKIPEIGAEIYSSFMLDSGNYFVVITRSSNSYLFDRDLNFLYELDKKNIAPKNDIDEWESKGYTFRGLGVLGHFDKYLVLCSNFANYNTNRSKYISYFYNIITKKITAKLEDRWLYQYDVYDNYIYILGYKVLDWDPDTYKSLPFIIKYNLSEVGIGEAIGGEAIAVTYTDKLNIESTISGVAEIKIYNMTGGLISLLPEQYINAGHNLINIDELPIGTYLYNIKINGIEYSGKFLRM